MELRQTSVIGAPLSDQIDLSCVQASWQCLNDAFPEPSKTVCKIIQEQGAELWHLAGTHGTVRSELPFACAGAVPCCAEHKPDAAPAPTLQCLVPARHLTGTEHV